MAKRIDVVDHAVAVLTHVKTKQLTEALEAQDKALQALIGTLREYNSWIEEQIVRLEGEK